VQAAAYAGEQLATECELVLGVVIGSHLDPPVSQRPPCGEDRAGHFDRPARHVGPDVVLGAGCRIGASSVVEGWTEIGDGTRSIRLPRSGCLRRT
jgi:acetyltransferase-like isoleucine patch superfamily enzyme